MVFHATGTLSATVEMDVEATTMSHQLTATLKPRFHYVVKTSFI